MFRAVPPNCREVHQKTLRDRKMYGRPGELQGMSILLCVFVCVCVFVGVDRGEREGKGEKGK